MRRVLIFSSQVAAGHVGLSAGMPALQALGQEVVGLPSVVLSNHPGFAHVAGAPVAPSQLEAMVDALEANGWLGGVDAVLTGYLPTPEHVDFAVSLIARVRALSSKVRVVVDPVLGDAPKGLYVAQDVAVRLRDRLVGIADVLTPNRFEMTWLTQGQAALPQRIIVTSDERASGLIGVTDHIGPLAERYSVPRLSGVPHGTGDVFAALIAAGQPVGAALGQLQALIQQSLDAPHLRIAQTARIWTAAAPLEIHDGL